MSTLKSYDIGKKSKEVFLGSGESKASYLTYLKTTEIVVDWLEEKLQEIKTIVDIGSHSGSFLSSLDKKLNLSHTYKIGVDIKIDDLQENIEVDEKIVANAKSLPLNDNFSDLTILRYVLQLNSKEDQRLILEEAIRITRKYLLLQLPVVSFRDQEYFQNIFSNIQIDRVRRSWDFYFLTKDEVDTILKNIGRNLSIKELPQVPVTNISDVFKDKYELNMEEYKIFKNSFKGHDNFTIMSWVLDKKKS